MEHSYIRCKRTLPYVWTGVAVNATFRGLSVRPKSCWYLQRAISSFKRPLLCFEGHEHIWGAACMFKGPLVHSGVHQDIRGVSGISI